MTALNGGDMGTALAMAEESATITEGRTAGCSGPSPASSTA